MATLIKVINKSLFDSILPTYGTPRVNIPTWDDSQKMFICSQYESANGHRYYLGIRFCDRIVIVEKVGLYHSWTYIDGIELYAFNGQKKRIFAQINTNGVHVKRLVNSNRSLVFRYTYRQTGDTVEIVFSTDELRG
jgi:hypothetical protein